MSGQLGLNVIRPCCRCAYSSSTLQFVGRGFCLLPLLLSYILQIWVKCVLAAVSCRDTNFMTIHLHVRQVSVIDCCHDLNMVLLRLSEVMLAITLCASTQISNHGSLQACCGAPFPTWRMTSSCLQNCVFLSLFNIFCFWASLWTFRWCVSWIFSTFPASVLASEVSGSVPSWGKSQDRYTTLEASPNAQRMLHGKLLWSCSRHNLAKICGRGLQCLTCYILTITLTFRLTKCEVLAHWSVLPKSHSGLWERIKRTKEINPKNLRTYVLHAKLSAQP